MPVFQFDAPQNRYAGTLAQIIAGSGDARARAAEQAANAQARATEVGGQAWGGAVRDIGQTIGAIPGQIAQQRSNALREQLLRGQVDDRNAEAAQRKQAAEYAKTKETVETIATLARGANDADHFVSRVNGLAKLGALAPDVAAHITQQAQNGEWAQVQKDYIDFGARYAKTLNVASGGKVINEFSGETIADNPKPEPPKPQPTPASIAFDAANPQSPTQAQSTTALDLMKPPKPEPAPRSLDEQLLEAITAKDGARAKTITGSMRAAAAAKGDPAAIAAANRQAATIAQQIAQQSRAQTFTENEKGRGELKTYETPFLDAREKVDTLKSVIALAKAGNKEAAVVQPLLATLGLVTAEGVKRINTTELQQVAGAGSLFDKIKAKAGKIVTGQPIPADLQNDLVQLADMLEQSARKKYEAGFRQTKTRYGLKDEVMMPPTNAPEKGTVGQVGGKPAVWDYRNDTWGWWPQQ